MYSNQWWSKNYKYEFLKAVEDDYSGWSDWERNYTTTSSETSRHMRKCLRMSCLRVVRASVVRKYWVAWLLGTKVVCRARNLTKRETIALMLCFLYLRSRRYKKTGRKSKESDTHTSWSDFPIEKQLDVTTFIHGNESKPETKTSLMLLLCRTLHISSYRCQQLTRLKTYFFSLNRFHWSSIMKN